MNGSYLDNKNFEKMIKDVGKQLKLFTKNKNNICAFVYSKNELANDLFAPCVCMYDHSKINSKIFYVFDDYKTDLSNLKNKFDGVVLFKCIRNAKKRSVTSKIVSLNRMEITFFIQNEIFKNEDYFSEFYYELGFE